VEGPFTILAEGAAMTVKPIHLPQHVLDSLQETAALLDGLPLEDLVAASVWAFGQQDREYVSWFVRFFWFDGMVQDRSNRGPGSGESTNWSVWWLSPAVGAALDKVKVRPFSKPQTLVALLAWFTAQPPDKQVSLVYAYREAQAETTRPVEAS
jgi:hypothetical protein